MKFYILVAIVLFCQQSMGQTVWSPPDGSACMAGGGLQLPGTMINGQCMPSSDGGNSMPEAAVQAIPAAQQIQTIPSTISQTAIVPNIPLTQGLVCNSGIYDPTTGYCNGASGSPLHDANGKLLTPNVPGYTGSNNNGGPDSGTAGAQACQAAASSAVMTCSSPQGIGGQSAAAIQQTANQMAMMQEQSAMSAQANGQSNGGVTVVNVTNNGQPANPAANAACNATKIMADANAISSVVASSFCIAAYNSCQAACDTGGNPNSSQALQKMGPSMLAKCNGALHVFEAQVIPQALNAVMMQKLGSTCNTQLAANANPPALVGPPGMPPTGEPQNAGYQGNPASSPSAAMFPTDGSGSGGSALGNSAYPGGPGDKTAQNGTAGSSIKDHDLSLSNGSGSVPFANNGAANMAGKAGAPFDLGSLFGDKDGDRKPAGMNEITGPTDLTNFQKVTRMMNKKRTTLKSGDGV